MKLFRLLALAVVPVLLSAASLAQSTSKSSDSRVSLNDGWALQSSAKVSEKGEAIASPSFQPKDWIKATVPTTVVAAQVKSGLLPDPLYGMNLRQYPGVSYPVGGNFSNLPMPPDSPYAVSWWYRKEFSLPKDFAEKPCG